MSNEIKFDPLKKYLDNLYGPEINTWFIGVIEKEEERNRIIIRALNLDKIDRLEDPNVDVAPGFFLRFSLKTPSNNLEYQRLISFLLKNESERISFLLNGNNSTRRGMACGISILVSKNGKTEEQGYFNLRYYLY